METATGDSVVSGDDLQPLPGLCLGNRGGGAQKFSEAATPSEAKPDTIEEETATASQAKKYPAFEYEEEFDGITVSLKAKRGILPEGTTAEIYELDPYELAGVKAEESAEDENGNDEAKLPDLAFDISLYDADGNDLGDSWQQNGDVTVTFSGERIDALKENAPYVEILHIGDDGREDLVKETEMTRTNRRREGLSFEAEHFSVYAVRAAAAVSGEVNSEETLKNAIEAADGEAVITIAGDFELTGEITIPAGKKITLSGAQTISFAANAGIVVPEGAELTLDGGLILSGGGREQKQAVNAILVQGKLIQKNATISSFASTREAVVLVKGNHAVYELTGGTISDNYNTGNPAYGAIQVLEGADLRMSGGLITGNEIEYTDTDCGTIIYIGIDGQGPNAIREPIQTKGATFEMTGGEISGNIAAQTVYIGEQNAALTPLPPFSQFENVYANQAKMTMSDGALITGNTAGKAGGGVCVWGPGIFEMNGGIISDNTAPMGGGVAATDIYTVGASTNQVYRDMPIEEWSKQCPATFIMNGGTISGNRASEEGGVGGGIYIASNTCELNGGEISGNEASDQGGGIYVSSLPYILKIKNALITENTAEILGGGMWLCPTGDARTTVTNGAAFFDNYAGEGAQANDQTAAGDDIASVNKFAEEGKYDAKLNLSNRMLGNWIVHWYRDGGVKQASEYDFLGIADESIKRYPGSEENGELIDYGIIEDNQEDIALKAVVSEEGKEAARTKAEKENGVMIRENSALRGGGIGSNGSIVFGKNPVSYSTADLTVKKVWADNENEEGKRPSEIIAELYEDGSLIDSVSLNQENDWSFTFVDLPVYGTNIAKEQESGAAKIEYEIKEQPVDGYEAVITPSVITLEMDKTLEVSIKNSLKQPEPEPEPEPEPKPDPEPDPKPEPEPETASISIEKNVTGKGSTTKEFNFELELTNQSDLNGTYGDLNFNEGTANFTLKHGEKKTASGLPDGTEFTVTEESAAWYTTSVDELDENGMILNSSSELSYSGILSAENGTVRIRYNNRGFSGGGNGGGGGGSSGGGGGGSTPGRPVHPEPAVPVIPEGESPESSASPHPEINRLPVMGVPGPEEAVATEDAAKTQQLEAANQPVIAALADKHAQNSDLGGWLTVPGTGGGYPVMYTPNNWEYYLHRDFNQQSSNVGLPFMGEATEIGGDNTLLHGHNMNGELQFGWIWNYQDPNFRAKHPTIDFKTIYDGDGQYEVMAVFFSPVYPAEQTNVFKWYQYVGKLNKAQFDYYVQNAKASSLYDTGVTAEYGDKLITLETCASYTTNERLVVVARKKAPAAAQQ